MEAWIPQCFFVCALLLLFHSTTRATTARGTPVVELNLEPTGNSSVCSLSIQGKAGELLPELFQVQDDPKVAAALAEAKQRRSSRS